MTRQSQYEQVLFTWVGNNDLNPRHGKQGPIVDALLSQLGKQLNAVVVLIDRKDNEPEQRRSEKEAFQQRLNDTAKKLNIQPIYYNADQAHPVDYAWTFDTLRATIDQFESEYGAPQARHFLLGPGTPTMIATMLVISRIRCCLGTLWQSDERHPQGIRQLQLPFDLPELTDRPDPQASLQPPASTDAPILKSDNIKYLYASARRAANSTIPILITGETGTGKEVLAQFIHKNSPRANNPFRPINCGAIPESLIESELFGYEKGAFTGANKRKQGIFESAQGGTVFLDEIGELPLPMQTRLLRVLQEGKITRVGGHTEIEVDCRIIAATHRNLPRMIQLGNFREDLYYRLAGIVLHIPPLRERREDLKAMIERFLNEIIRQNPGFPGSKLTKAAHAELLRYNWPGNVRQLRQVLTQLVFWAEDYEIDLELTQRILQDQPDNLPQNAKMTDQAQTPLPDPLPERFDLKQYLDELRRQAVLQLYDQGLTQKQIAERLMLSQSTVSRITKGQQALAKPQ